MGDSTSRRASMTLYALLNSTTHSFPSNSTNHSTTHPTVDELDDKYESDINKEAAAAHSHTETCNIKKFQVGAYTPNICSPMPASGVGYVMVVHHISCTNQIQWMVKLHTRKKRHSQLICFSPTFGLSPWAIGKFVFPSVATITRRTQRWKNAFIVQSTA